ncbi:MAG TPA: hypothetical protein VEV86_10395 [Vicinamibacterales bacterium]|nr:hypothetical protein [Vicinamibacterales bacterium]
MAVRRRTSSRTRAPAGPVSIDVVVLSFRERRLLVLADGATDKRHGVTLPWGTLAGGEQLDQAAARIARKAVGVVPQWMEQAGAFADGTAHPGGAVLSVCYASVVPWTEAPAPRAWIPVHPLPRLVERHRRMLSSALGVVRHRLEHEPIAFSLLAREFTLSELQQAYETMLSRRLHKASFRRALHAAFLVEPTGEWRGEGRGRPAQLFRLAPRRRKGERRGVRLDLL